MRGEKSEKPQYIFKQYLVKFKVALLYCYKHQYASLRSSCLNNAIQDRKKISVAAKFWLLGELLEKPDRNNSQ